MSTEQPTVFRTVAKSRAADPEIVKSMLNLSQIQQQNGQGNHMRSCIFQLRRHQTHSTFPLSQAEFALDFYPLAFVLVILDLVPFLAFLGSSQRRAGQPDPPLFAVAEILAVSVDFVCQNTTGVVSLAPPLC